MSLARRINVHFESLSRMVCWPTSDSSLQLNDFSSAISQNSICPTSPLNRLRLAGFLWHVIFEAWTLDLSDLTPLKKQCHRNKWRRRGGESASVWRGGEGMLGRGQLRRMMGGFGSRCSSRTASNYIQSVKPSITPRLACLSSCYSSERSSQLWLLPRDTLQGRILHQARVRTRSHKFFAPITAYFKQYSQSLASPLVL